MSLYAYVLESKNLNDVLKDLPEGISKLDYAIMYDKGLPENKPCYLVSRVDVYKEMDLMSEDLYNSLMWAYSSHKRYDIEGNKDLFEIRPSFRRIRHK